MNDIFEIIDALRNARGLSSRKLAERAGLKPTTFASMMTRKPTEIPKAYLQSLSAVLGVRWYDLLNVSSDAYSDDTIKVPTTLSSQDKEEVLLKVLGPGADPSEVYAEQIAAQGNPLNANPVNFYNHDHVIHAQHKQAICLILDTLNFDGLREVMNYAMRLSNDPDYSARKKHLNKEDTE